MRISDWSSDVCSSDLLLRAVGEDPDRDGLRETPARVVRAFAEYCAGYAKDPVAELRKTFDEVSGYQSLIILTDLDFVSHFEQHLATIVGGANVAYQSGRASCRERLGPYG